LHIRAKELGIPKEGNITVSRMSKDVAASLGEELKELQVITVENKKDPGNEKTFL
jgi:hypothetical protein